MQVSTPGPDERVSLGVSVGSTLPVVLSAPLVIAQMNPRMPYTFGAGELPRHAFDFLVEADEPLLEVIAEGGELRATHCAVVNDALASLRAQTRLIQSSPDRTANGMTYTKLSCPVG